ncbi:lysozyme inhibitor LprI family protein [Pantoea sp. B65]|uniref:lysozyme inhibitor LprI family protein n=1 Tax=Pantoea sp. B65 TaxID=2813359 RepID=UPI0039B548E9
MRCLLITTIALSSLFPDAGSAALHEGKEARDCFFNNTDRYAQEDCLFKKRQESDKKIDSLISETNKRIKANNLAPFNGKADAKETSGEVYSRRFMAAQNKWKEYRDELCLAVATELDEDAYDYQLYIAQCQINLNQRHIEEINMMDLPSAS